MGRLMPVVERIAEARAVVIAEAAKRPSPQETNQNGTLVGDYLKGKHPLMFQNQPCRKDAPTDQKRLNGEDGQPKAQAENAPRARLAVFASFVAELNAAKKNKRSLKADKRSLKVDKRSLKTALRDRLFFLKMVSYSAKNDEKHGV